jgi:hypothetical protein
MDLDLKKLRKITLFMKKEGVLSLKTQNIEISLSQSSLSFPKENSKKKKFTDEKLEEEEKNYTDEQILMWSSPGFIPTEIDK